MYLVTNVAILNISTDRNTNIGIVVVFRAARACAQVGDRRAASMLYRRRFDIHRDVAR